MGVGTLEGWVVGSDVDGWDVGAVVDGFTRDRHSQILSSFALLQPMVPSFLAHASPFPSCHPLIQSIFYRPKKKQKEKKKINQIKKYKQKFKSFLLMGLNLMNNLFCFGFWDRFLVVFTDAAQKLAQVILGSFLSHTAVHVVAVSIQFLRYCKFDGLFNAAQTEPIEPST